MNATTPVFWKWFAIIMIAVNIGILALFFSGGSKRAPDGPPPGDQNALNKYVIEKLGFDKEQEKAYLRLREDLHVSMDPLQKQGGKLRHDLFEGLRSDTVPPAVTQQLSEQIADNQEQIEMMTFHHFEAVKKLCNDAQKKIFNEIIQDVLRRMARRPGPPKHDGPPPPPGK